MMTYSDDQIALAAEYALGTLDADERVQVEVLMHADPAFNAVVEAWARKFDSLNDMVGAATPSDAVWTRIKAEIAAGRVPEHAAATDIKTAESIAPDTAVITAPVVTESTDNVIAWSGRVRRWRSAATAMTAIAAGLACVIGLQAYRPDLLPAALRAPEQSQIADTARMPKQYVALLQSDSNSPAFILTVDAAAKTFMVRKVGATMPAGKSYELWMVSDRLASPKSLGLIGYEDFTLGPKMRGGDNDMMMHATYAVTVEPEGGAPGGVATGPIVFTGKLIETVPSDMPAAPTPR
jgi:anti-sigma-K factor RskA